MSRLALLLAVLLSLAGPASAQQDGAIAVVDQERMFSQSAFGQRVLAEIDRRGEDLATENRRIEAELIAEERALTDLRPSLDPAEFRQRAQAFDEKVRGIRAEQDAKARALAGYQETARQDFAARAAPVLSDLLEESAATILLDRRVVLAVEDAADITGEAVERIDAAIGDGAGDGDAPER